MNIRWEISQSEGGKFMNSCEAVIRNVGNGTKTACELACAEIMAESLEQVPKDTWTLASTGDYIVRNRSDVKGYSYEGILGYAGFATSGVHVTSDTFSPRPHWKSPTVGVGNGKFMSRGTDRVGAQLSGWKRGLDGSITTYDAVNPKSGLPASSYAAIVHEDLDMRHPGGGKAKFLEDPVRTYASRFKRVAETHWRWAINWVDGRGRNTYGKIVDVRMPVYGHVKLTSTQAGPHGPRGGRFI